MTLQVTQNDIIQTNNGVSYYHCFTYSAIVVQVIKYTLIITVWHALQIEFLLTKEKFQNQESIYLSLDKRFTKF